MSYCLVVDLKKCVGCGACAAICKAENGTPPGSYRCKVLRGETGKFPNVKRHSIPTQCMHCADPPCASVCPTGATKRNNAGVVIVDKDKCIGCRACIVACPYDARTFRSSEQGYFGKNLTEFEMVKYIYQPKGVVDKCDLCYESRVNKGFKPACVQNCIANARYFGSPEELSFLIRRRSGYQMRAELGTNPSLYYLP